MESPITMGEAGDNVCKEKTKHVDDGACVNGDCDEQMEVCEIDSKAPEVNSNNIDSLKNCEKVPANKVPIETVTEDDDDDEDDDEEPMEVDIQPNEKENCISDDDDDILEDDTEITSKQSQNNGTEKHDGKEGAVNGESSENSVNGTTIILDDSKSKNDKSESEQLNDSGDVVLIENDSEHKENGDVCSSPDIEEIINISDRDASKENNESISLVSPASKKKPSKKPADKSLDVTPRRSSRNLNKQRSYVEKEAPEEPQQVKEEEEDAESDIEEVTPEDPLAVTVVREPKVEKKKSKQTVSSSSTIVVSDTKRLVEIAANSKPSTTTGKKEPTLVIIDTNSILSGRGPVPVTSHKSNQMSSSFSMVPVALPAQGVYPPNMRATITPIPMASSTPSKQSSTVASISAVSAIVPSLAVSSASVSPAAPILPTLTDDMYVVEAPSFIVPYVYEKPPIKPFKEFVTQIHKELKELAKQEAEKNKNKAKDEEDDDEDDDEDEDNEKSDSATKKDNDDAKSDSSDKDEDEKTKDDSSKKDDSDDEDSEKVSKDSKKKEDNMKTIDLDDIPDEKTDIVKPKSSSYFDNALGSFFINIGYGLVQEYVQTDLLKQQKRKQKSEGTAPETKMAINSLIKNLEYSKENNEPYKMEQKRCEFCSFRTESELVLAHHLETPHMRNYVYKCNFCTTEVRSPHDILFHMEAEHNTRGRLERAPAFHQCPNCPFEDNQKGKLSRHLVTCLKKFKPECNLSPPVDWEPPAKIPRVPRMKQQGLQATAATYQALAQAKGNYQLFSKLQQASSPQAFPRGRGRPSLMGSKVSPIRPQTPIIRTNMMYRPGAAGGSVLVPTTYQFGGNQIFQVVGGGQSELGAGGRLSATSTPVALVPNLVSAQSTVTIQNSSGNKSSGKVVQQPSISITPLPRQSAGSSTTITKTSGGGGAGGAASVTVTTGESSSSKATFVICEICDGYIKDLEQLRNHMQWIHKVKIHPKMIYNRPPLNCQKCQFRFFTDQGLERHLLGSHGLVTSSMQEAANKSKDAGRCPVCGRVYQWKLLNHVARDHNMTLKPAHLSYKCTVCTATFGMYKQFENHVYSAHSVVAKRVMDKKSSPSTTTSSSSATTSGATISSRNANDSLLKPLKINDEITIIPQPAKSSKTSSSSSSSTRISNANNDKGK